jgi:hypothetical protein
MNGSNRDDISRAKARLSFSNPQLHVRFQSDRTPDVIGVADCHMACYMLINAKWREGEK